jgi:hypothetical protein
MQSRDCRGRSSRHRVRPSRLSLAVDRANLPRELNIPAARKAAVANAVGTWSFSAHDFTDDELLHGALVMLEHVLSMPELEKWRMPTGK